MDGRVEGDLPTKTCTKCGQTFPATTEHFTRDKNRPQGIRAYCKSCERISRRNYKVNNRERYREAKRLYELARPEKKKARNKNYRIENRDKLKEYGQRWRENNPDYFPQYWKENPEIAKANNQKRRARLLTAGGTHTADDIKLQIKAQTDKNDVLRCWWCNKPIKGKYHIDHRIPLSKGGSNDAGNICIAHPKCNMSKHDKLPWEFNGRLL